MKKTLMIFAGLLVLVLLSFYGYQQLRTEKVVYQAPRFDNLGDYHRPVSTSVPMAQTFFDQGLVLFYGFQWGESIRSFREAARLDPNCGACYWGLALALSNKINEPETGNEFAEGQEAINKALALSSQATPIEQELIQALALHYLHAPILKKMDSTFSCHESSTEIDTSSAQHKMAYIAALKMIAEKYPEDVDVKTLYASALYFVVMPTDPKEDNPIIQEAQSVLRAALTLNPLHPGANHYYIHVIEPFAHPGYATESADRLQSLVPGSEHLVHMPSHIYFLTGKYHEASEANLRSLKTYQAYNDSTRAQGFEPVVNYLYFHNIDFLRSSASMEGNKALALKASQQLMAEPFPSWLKNESELQWFLPIPAFVEARFGLWSEILSREMPDTQYTYARGMMHYARGLALLHQGQLESAHQEAKHLEAILGQGETNGNLGKNGHVFLTIANSVLNAALANHYGMEKLTFDHLNYASKLQDRMRYHEPPDWYFPIRQALGDAYLRWGHPEKAKVMYELDLIQYPQNGWSLYGLEKSLRALGQQEKAELVHQQFVEAWKHADIPAPLLHF